MVTIMPSAIKCVLLGALVCLSCAVHAQDQGQALLYRATHCLAIGGFLPPSKAAAGTFGYLLDEKSYPGKKMLYVVDYPTPSGLNGFAFTLLVSEYDGRQNFNIENNVRFAVSRDSDEEVSFVDPPLGGNWVEEHLTFAIKQIEKQPKFTITAKDMLTVDSSVDCQAYNDLQPAPKAK